MTIQMVKHLFTVRDLRRMVEAGILAEDARVELIDGEIVEMPPLGSHHNDVADVLAEMFSVAARQMGFMTRIQGSIQLNDKAQPQPDIAILKQRNRACKGSLPLPDDILLVVEVSDPTLISDQLVKAPLYARNDIPEFWIVDLTTNTIQIHRDPFGGEYRSETIASRGDTVSPSALPALILSVDEIFG